MRYAPLPQSWSPWRGAVSIVTFLGIVHFIEVEHLIRDLESIPPGVRLAYLEEARNLLPHRLYHGQIDGERDSTPVYEDSIAINEVQHLALAVHLSVDAALLRLNLVPYLDLGGHCLFSFL